MKLLSTKLILGLVIILSGTSPLFSFQMKGKQAKVRAPEFTGGKGWLNTDKRLSIAGLKGKIVLIDFWTYGCINCIHIIPELKKLEAKYRDQLVVIGVHSAKFENEGETENIRNVILRYGIEHPVYNDSGFKSWDQYAVNAYPTQVLIDPAGYISGTFVGEGHFAEIDSAIDATVSEFRGKGTLNEEALSFALERAKVGSLPLSFPGKVLADSASKRLFIADSNHNRIVITDFSGKLLETVGNGIRAFKDGSFADAGFNNPQGMALDGKFLYVADTENHSIRRIDLVEKKVETIAGTGNLNGFNGFGGDALRTVLRSPWDLSLVGRELFIAMAGSHQIWVLDLERDFVQPFAGTTVEARIDGKAARSAFAQPSGIVSDGKDLFVADSESNIIRKIGFKNETVETLVGGDLWVFGDVDGEGDDVRLQHPLGIELYGEKVLIADTYNHKIKILDAKRRTVRTFLGSGKSGQADGKNATFYEPGGISLADGKLFVADTNNQAIRVVDLKSKITSTLKIEGLKPPVEIVGDAVSPNLKEITVAPKTIAVGTENSLIVNVELPAGFHLNPDAPQRFVVNYEGGNGVKFDGTRQKFKELPLTIPFQATNAETGKLKVDLTIYYCREDNTGVCLIKTLSWIIPITVSQGKNALTKLELLAKVD